MSMYGMYGMYAMYAHLQVGQDTTNFVFVAEDVKHGGLWWGTGRTRGRGVRAQRWPRGCREGYALGYACMEHQHVRCGLCSCCDDRTATRIDVVFTHIYSAHYANSGALCIACQVGPFQGASFRRSRVGPQTVVGLSRLWSSIRHASVHPQDPGLVTNALTACFVKILYAPAWRVTAAQW